MSDEQAPHPNPGSHHGIYTAGQQPGTSGSETRRYRIIGVLGRGGFGTVYHARLESKIEGSDDFFVKDVAIKLLSETEPAAETLSRFRDEARILGRLRDRSIVSVDPPTRLDGRWGVVMEFVDGVDCRRLIREHGRIPPTVALGIIEEVARTLDNLWNHPGEDGQPMRLLHRDLKPSNLQVTPSGAVKVLDFGVARADFGQRETSTTSHIAGTVGYIAPERGEGVEDPRGDVFSLGVVLEELVTGRRPLRPGESSRSAAKRLNVSGEAHGSSARLPPVQSSTPNPATGSRSRSPTPGPSRHTPSQSPSSVGYGRSQAGLARSSSRIAMTSGSHPPPAPPIPDADAIPPEILRFAQEMRAPNPNDRPMANEVEQRCAAMIRDLYGPTLREWARDHVHRAPLVPLQATPDALVGQMLSETLARVSFDKPPAPSRGNPAFAAALLAVSATAALLVMAVGLGSLGAGMWWWTTQRVLPVGPDGGREVVDTVPLPLPEVVPVLPVPTDPEPVVAAPPPRPRPPRPPRPPPASAETGTVSQEGAVAVDLVGEAGRFGAGKVPVGTYSVSATFEGSEPVSAGVVTVTAGSRIQLRCDARFKRCMQR